MCPYRISAEEQAIILTYQPLVDAELRRLGISEVDQHWLHAGSDNSATVELYEAWLASLRRLPTNLGVEAYCATLGFDYHEMKREIFRDVQGDV